MVDFDGSCKRCIIHVQLLNIFRANVIPTYETGLDDCT